MEEGKTCHLPSYLLGEGVRAHRLSDSQNTCSSWFFSPSSFSLNASIFSLAVACSFSLAAFTSRTCSAKTSWCTPPLGRRKGIRGGVYLVTVELFSEGSFLFELLLELRYMPPLMVRHCQSCSSLRGEHACTFPKYQMQ